MHDALQPALIAYDGSEEAAAAVCHAGRLLLPRPAVVVRVWDSLSGLLLHTDVERLTGTLAEAARELDEEDERDAQVLAAKGVELARKAGFEATPQAARGKPKAWPTLLEIADEIDAAVVVTGCRGLGGVRSALLGSVSSGVLHHSRRPVLIVPPVEEEEPPGPLVIGYDGSPAAREALHHAARLLSVREALIETVWAPYSPVAGAGTAGAPVAVVTSAAERLAHEIEVGARHTAEEGARLGAAEGLEVRPMPVEAVGNAWRTLIESAHGHRAAAVVVGSHGHSALAAAVLGSVSRALVHHAAVPVLVVPPAGD